MEALKNAQNSAQIGQGQSRMNYTDSKGKEQNLGSQMRNVQGRAVYQVGSNWVDSKLQTEKRANATRRIKFASAAYFELLSNEPKAAPFLALGRNVSFVLKDEVYEVFE